MNPILDKENTDNKQRSITNINNINKKNKGKEIKNENTIKQ